MSAAVSIENGKVRLRVISDSELRTLRSCMKRHHYAYRLRRRPIEVAEVLRFGTLWHVGQEVYWGTEGTAEDRLAAALGALRAHDADPFQRVMAEELLVAYAARWDANEYRTVAVEIQFEMPLVNPATGAASRTFVRGGKIDVIIADADGKLFIMEHKTTAADIEQGAPYWRRVRALDSQVSTYMSGARSLGYDVDSCVYDVCRKPGIRPGKATPIEDRKYTVEKSKACPECKKKSAAPGPHQVEIGRLDVELGDAAGEPVFASCVDGRIVTDPGGRLHANMREADETPEEYRERLRVDISERVERYFSRGPIVRLPDEEREHAFDVWQMTRLMREAETAGFTPRNPDACSAMGPCPYLPVCEGEASIDDNTRYRTASTSHEELATP